MGRQSMTQTTLVMGRLEVTLEPDSGWLRTVRFVGIECLRAMYLAVRDEHWGSIPPQIVAWKLETQAATWQLEFQVLYGNWMHWAVSMTCTSTSLEATLKGVVLEDFLGNRAGMCLLHPPLLAGRAYTAWHTDGSSSQGVFPKRIAAHQPLINLSGLAYPIDEQHCLTLQLTGEVFETEDQRNWSDASYKTYGTPLALPFPHLFRAGERLEQHLHLEVQASTNMTLPKTATLFSDEFILPPLGLALPEHTPLEAVPLEVLTATDFLRLELRFNTNWLEDLQQAAQYGLPLELALHFYQPKADALALQQALHDIAVIRILLFEEQWHGLLNSLLPDIPVVLGTNANFAELNRHPPSQAKAVCFSLNPQVHAFDTQSIFETLEVMPEMIESARSFAAQVFVTPITLTPRFNAVQTSPTSPEQLLDSRLQTRIGAAWALASIAVMAAAKVNGITLFATHGKHGIANTPILSVLQQLKTQKNQGLHVSIKPNSIQMFNSKFACVINTSSKQQVLSLPNPWAEQTLEPYDYLFLSEQP
jgi:D-apionolactonase